MQRRKAISKDIYKEVTRVPFVREDNSFHANKDNNGQQILIAALTQLKEENWIGNFV